MEKGEGKGWKRGRVKGGKGEGKGWKRGKG